MPNNYGDDICNMQMDKMWRRVINISKTFPYYYSYKIINKLQKYLNFMNMFIALPIGHSLDPMNLLSSTLIC